MISRLLSRLIYGLLGLFILIATSIYVVTGTTPGTRWLIHTAISLGHQPIQIQTIEGNLLGELRLRSIHLHTSTQTIAIDAVKLRWQPLALFRGRLRIDALSASGVTVHIAGHSLPAYPSKSSPDYRIALPLTVNLIHFTIHNLSVRDQGKIWQFKQIKASALLRKQRLKIRQLRIVTAQGHTEMTGRLELAPPYQTDLRLVFSGKIHPNTVVGGQASLQGDENDLQVSAQLNTPFPMRLQGHVAPRQQTTQLTLYWSQMRWPLVGYPEYQSPSGKLILRGALSRYTLQLAAHLKGKNLPLIELTLSGQGNRKVFNTTILHVTGFQGTISGNIHLRWQPIPQWQANLHGEHLDLTSILAKFPARLGFQLLTTGAGRRIDIRRLRVQGTLRGRPLLLEASAHWAGKTLDLRQLIITSGANHFRVEGSLQRHTGTLRAIFDLPELQQLKPTLRGQIKGRIELAGKWLWPQIQANIHGSGIAFRGTHIKTLQLSAHVAAKRHLNVDLVAENLQRGSLSLHRLEAHVSGTLKHQALLLDIFARRGKIELRARGGFDMPTRRWKGQLTRLMLQVNSLPRWQLAKPARLEVTKNDLQLRGFCLQSTPSVSSRLCIDFSKTQQRLKLKSTWQTLPLSLANPWLPNEIHIKGSLSGRADFTGPLKNLSGILETNLDRGEILRASGGKVQKLRFNIERAQISLAHGKLLMALQAQIPQYKARLTWTLGLDKLNTPGQYPLSGQLDARLPSLAALQSYVPKWPGLKGQAIAKLEFSGTLEKPQITGFAAMRDAQVEIPMAGIQVQAIQAQAVMPLQGHDLLLEASASSGGGTLHLKAKVKGLLTSHPQATLQLIGKNFLAINLAMARVRVSPQLRVSADAKKIRVRGKVEVPRARIRIQRLPSQAIPVSADVMIVGQHQEKSSSGPKLDLLIKIILGHKVTFDTFGLSGQLAGNLLLHQQSNQPTIANGTLDIIHGAFSGYGLDLPITKGVLNFAGPVNNPGLNILIQRQTPTVTASLGITGTLQAPQTTISSQPALPQATALSWLLTGQGLNGASRADTGILLKAITQLGIQNLSSRKGGPSLLSQIEKGTGFSEIGVQGGSTWQQSSLVLGRYLTPKLYIRYTTGLFQRLQHLELTYQLTKKISLQVQSGATQAASVLYQINFGH